MTVEQIIQDSIKEAKVQKEKARRIEIRKLLDYYTGTETTKYISNYFSADAFKEIPLYNANFTRRFVNKMSRIYTVGASRNMDEQYSILTRKKDARMKHVERMTRLCGTIATQVIYRDDSVTPCFDYRPIYYFSAHFDDNNPFTPSAITYPILFGADDPSYTAKLQYAYWDSQIYAHYDEDGNIMEEYEHGYGVIPFLFTHKEELIDSFFVEGATDIASCNEQVNITMTELQLGLRFQMFGQPFITGLNGDKALERAGSDTILDLPEGANFGIVSPSGNIESVIENVKFQIDLIAQNNHLYVQFAQDGFEDYQDDLDLWNMYEHDLYEVEKAIAEYNGIKLPEELNIDFNEPEYPKTVRDQIDLDNHRLVNNLVTQGKLLVEYNKDLTLDEADAIIEENREKNKETKAPNPFEMIQPQEEEGSDA